MQGMLTEATKNCFLLLRHLYGLGPLPQGSVTPDGTAALPHNSVNGGQPQPRPFAPFLGGVEWFKNMR